MSLHDVRLDVEATWALWLAILPSATAIVVVAFRVNRIEFSLAN